MPLPLTILQPTTLMILQHTMLPTEMPLAERTIAHDALRRLRTILESAFLLLGRSAAEERKRHCEG